MKIIWTPLAQDDLAAIFEYILTDNPGAALKVVGQIEAAADRLLEFPRKGRPGIDPASRQLVLPGLPYIIFYTIVADILYITNVTHGARDWRHD